MSETRLSPVVLRALGFVELEEKDIVGRSIFSLDNIKHDDGIYPFAIHVVLNPQYPDTNPNCGTVDIYMKEETLNTVPEDLIDKDEWTEEDQQRVDDHLTVFEATSQPIAWYVVTIERLNMIVEGLTRTSLV